MSWQIPLYRKLSGLINENTEPNKIVEILFLCFSESSFDKEVWHQGRYQSLCGVDKDIWGDYIAENGVERNSLQSGLLIYEFYLDKNNGDLRKTLLEYKGVVKNKKVKRIVKKIIRMQEEVKDKYVNILSEVIEK